MKVLSGIEFKCETPFCSCTFSSVHLAILFRVFQQEAGGRAAGGNGAFILRGFFLGKDPSDFMRTPLKKVSGVSVSPVTGCLALPFKPIGQEAWL